MDARLYANINSEIDRILNDYAFRIIMIAKRYEHVALFFVAGRRMTYSFLNTANTAFLPKE